MVHQQVVGYIVQPKVNYGLRRQSEAATALSIGEDRPRRRWATRISRRTKAVSRFACHRTPKGYRQLVDALSPKWKRGSLSRG
jgi:hypothetical protein